MLLIVIRSILFQVVFYLNCLFWFTGAILSWPFPSRVMMWFARSWAASSLYLHELITGAEVEIRGLDNIPTGPLLVAAKHYSAWETMALLLFFPKATYIIKRELIWLPLFGLHLLKAEQVPINRADKGKAMAVVYAAAKSAIARNRQIIIFPEGTRRQTGAPPSYRAGVVRIYEALGVRCLPIAMTSGLAWPRNTFLHFPRKIIVEFLEPMEPGIDQQAFFGQLQARIETNTNRLLAEAGFQA